MQVLMMDAVEVRCYGLVQLEGVVQVSQEAPPVEVQLSSEAQALYVRVYWVLVYLAVLALVVPRSKVRWLQDASEEELVDEAVSHFFGVYLEVCPE